MHASSTLPAFVLSQNQTLRRIEIKTFRSGIAGDRFLFRVRFESQHKLTLLSGAAFRARPMRPRGRAFARKSGFLFKERGRVGRRLRGALDWMSGADWGATGQKSSKSPPPSQHGAVISCETSLCKARFASTTAPADARRARCISLRSASRTLRSLREISSAFSALSA